MPNVGTFWYLLSFKVIVPSASFVNAQTFGKKRKQKIKIMRILYRTKVSKEYDLGFPVKSIWIRHGRKILCKPRLIMNLFGKGSKQAGKQFRVGAILE